MSGSAEPLVLDPLTLFSLLDKPKESERISKYLQNSPAYSSPDVKEYPDATYHNYPSLGLSLCFTPSPSLPNRYLEYIDIYNPPPLPPGVAGRRKGKEAWEGYSAPTLPITFTFPSTTLTIPPPKPGESSREVQRPEQLAVQADTKGKDFVRCFGEPTKMGGGKGTPPFLEWDGLEVVDGHGVVVRLGVMMELRDPGGQDQLTEEQKRRGAGGVWDRAAEWYWVGLKIFKPSPKP